MQRHHWTYSLLLLIASTLFCACHTDKADEGVLSAGKMENVLYDYHLAQALAQQAPNDSVDYYVRLYQQLVFEKYGIDNATFDHSMQWYERHSDQLKKIYERVAERMGGSADGNGNRMLVGLNSASGDTLSIWHGPSSVLLNSQGINRFTYSQRADTTLRYGDILQWTVNTSWFYREGEHRAVACITIRYEGDSIATQQQFLYSDGDQTMTTRIGKRKVKSIDFFIYQCAPWADRVRLLYIRNMQLIRIRPHEVQEEEQAPGEDADTIKRLHLNPERRLRDSLLRLDTLNERKPHFI